MLLAALVLLSSTRRAAGTVEPPRTLWPAPGKTLKQRAMLAAALSGFSPKSAYACCTLCAPGSCSPGCGLCAGWGGTSGRCWGDGCWGGQQSKSWSTTWPRLLWERRGSDSTLPFPQKKNERAQEVCSGLFVLDKPFALFVLLPHAVLGRGVTALRDAKANSASSPLRTLHCRRPSSQRRRRWDKRKRVKETVEKPTILTAVVMRNLEIVSIHEEKRWSFNMD